MNFEFFDASNKKNEKNLEKRTCQLFFFRDKKCFTTPCCGAAKGSSIAYPSEKGGYDRLGAGPCLVGSIAYPSEKGGYD